MVSQFPESTYVVAWRSFAGAQNDSSRWIGGNRHQLNPGFRRGEGGEAWLGGPLWSPGGGGRRPIQRWADIFKQPTVGDRI